MVRQAVASMVLAALGAASCAQLIGLEEARCTDCGEEPDDDADDELTVDDDADDDVEPDPDADDDVVTDDDMADDDGADDDVTDDDATTDDDVSDDDVVADDDAPDDDAPDDDATTDDDVVMDDDVADDDVVTDDDVADDDVIADDDVADDDAPVEMDAGEMPEAGPALTPEELRAEACDEYCTLVMATCVGEDQQFLSADSCLEVCNQQMRLASELEQSTNNTIDCRVESARNAAEAGEVQLSCQEAGMMGGGRCGEPCEIYCDSLGRACGAEPTVTLPTDCLATCADVPQQGGLFSPNITGGNVLECRLNHLRLATESRQPDAHCPHALGAPPCG